MSGPQSIPGYKTTRYTSVPGNDVDLIEKRDRVTVHASGLVVETAAAFWSTRDPGQEPFEYQAGVGDVITGAIIVLTEGLLTQVFLTRRCVSRLGPRLLGDVGWRGSRVSYSRIRRIRQRRVLGVGHSTRRFSAIHS